MQIRPDISRWAQAQEPPGGYRKAISAVNSRTPLRKSELLLLRNPFLCCARASQPWQSSPLTPNDQLDTSAPVVVRSQRVRKRRKLTSVEDGE